MPRFLRATWLTATLTCEAFDMQIVSFDTAEEMEEVRKMLIDNNLPSVWMHIGAMTKDAGSRDEWYWTATGKKTSFDFPWASDQPSFHYNNEWCLNVEPNINGGFLFHDVQCTGCCENSFICQQNHA